MLTHVLLTRFNLATPGRESAIRNKPGWLEERFALFETYCLPSVAAQTDQDFHWLIYFDEHTPEDFKARIGRLSENGSLFTPYYTGMFPGEGWGRSIHEVLTPTGQYVLTTRLDNDDSLAVDFMARLHAEIHAHDMAEGAYNFRQGAICQGDRLYAIAHESAPFFSLLEPLSDTLCTAPNIHHMRIAEGRPVIQIDGAPAWMQIVHGTNVSNRVRGRRVAPAYIEGLFPTAISDQLSPVSDLALWSDHNITGRVRRLRDGLVNALRREHKIT